MKRILVAIVSIVLVLGALFVGYKILSTKPPAPVDEHGHDGGHDEHEEEVVKGPNGGRLFGEKDFQTEVSQAVSAGLTDPLAIDALVKELSPYFGRICGAVALDHADDSMQ